MNSRQRIKKVLEHKVPDRVPIDFGASRATGIVGTAYNNLRKQLGINNGLAHMDDFIENLVGPEKEILDLFNVDIIDAAQGFLKSEDDYRKWKLDDGSEILIPKFYNIEEDSNGNVNLKNSDGLVLAKKPKSSPHLEQVYWVYKDLPGIPDEFKNEDLSKYFWALPRPPWHLDIFNEDEYELFIKGIRELYENTDYSIMATVGFSMFETGCFLRGMENFLCDIYMDKSGVERLLDKLLENNLKKLEKIINGVGKYIDMIRFVDDMGSQDRPFIPPDKYRDIFKPRHKKMWDYVHNNSDCKVRLHSCGSIYELLPDIIDAGIDVIDPVQNTARDMEPEKLKKEFGKDVIFCGGCCNTRDVLGRGSPKDVREDVRNRIDILGEGGGLIFSQIHNIQAEVPPENIIAMFEAAMEYGKYS